MELQHITKAVIPAVTSQDTKGEVDDVPIHHAMINNDVLLAVILKGAAFDAGHPLGFRAAVHFAGRQLTSSDTL